MAKWWRKKLDEYLWKEKQIKQIHEKGKTETITLKLKYGQFALIEDAVDFYLKSMWKIQGSLTKLLWDGYDETGFTFLEVKLESLKKILCEEGKRVYGETWK